MASAWGNAWGAAWGSAWGVIGPVVALVETPTKLRHMHRAGTAGETLIISEQLLGRSQVVQELPVGTKVTLTMDPPDGGTAVIDEASCTVDNDANTVTFEGDVPSEKGQYQYQFHMITPDGRDLYFPDGNYATLTVIPAVV